MNMLEKNNKASAIAVLNEISKIVQDIEKNILVSKVKPKECKELKLLKEKCCSEIAIVSLSAFHGMKSLIERKILSSSQTISMLISLLPFVNHYGALVSTMGSILLTDVTRELPEKKNSECVNSLHVEHPFITVLKSNYEKSWFEIFHFILQLIQMNEDIEMEHKIKFLCPIFRHTFWSSSWRGSQFQMKLFNALMMQINDKQILDLSLESLLWQEMDVHYCMFLEEFFCNLLSRRSGEMKAVICGLSPTLAHAVKWLIVKGYDPCFGLKTLKDCCQLDTACGSVILYILTDVITQTPSMYINSVIDVCKIIIFSQHCSKYVVYKFIAAVLNWFVSPSFLANPLYKILEDILEFVSGDCRQWNDQTQMLNENKYFRVFGSNKKDLKFAVDLILASAAWVENKAAIKSWLDNLLESNENEMQLKLHSFVQGIILCEESHDIINRGLDLVLKLVDYNKEIAFSNLCLLFYKLGREKNPIMQKTYLFSLPKLAVKKENIPLILGIIDSLKRGNPKIMTPLVIQLYLSLWKLDNRTYSYLHKMLHDNTSVEFAWELNVSKAVALKDICLLAPHLHAKDLVGVLSKILNECSGDVGGLPSAIAIEAVTELCKAFVIDVGGTWNAIQPKLRFDRRPKIIKSLCRFFREIPNLNSVNEKSEQLSKDIVPMLWDYTFSKEPDVTRHAFRALASYPVENLPLKLFPDVYKVDLKLPKDSDKKAKPPEDILALPYVPAQCWLQFLEKIDEEVLQDGGQLVTVLIERELTSLPRGIFYLPPEKAEPLSYSYLPSRSICRCLVERLQKYARNDTKTTAPTYLKEVLRILSNEYSKFLPPLDWRFLESLLSLDSDCQKHCLSLLVKQGSVSATAKCLLENYFRSVDWDSDELEQLLFFYDLLPQMCKSLSYGILQNFFQSTMEHFLEKTLREGGFHFGNILQNVTQALRKKPVHAGLIVRQLERLLDKIPPEHEVMEKFAICATEFPVKSIESMTSVGDSKEVGGDWLRRAVTIRCAIAMRPDIKNPLVWLNEVTEVAALIPAEHEFILNTIWSVIRKRRNCDHRVWMQELMWRTQASISTPDSNEVTLFLADVFVTATIILSGFDCLFPGEGQMNAEKSKKLQLFPQAVSALMSFAEWNDMLPKLRQWLRRLLRWKFFPEDRVRAFVQAFLSLEEARTFADDSELATLYNSYSLPFL